MQPLKGKTILVTRSAFQAEYFTNQLQDLGAKTIVFPLIKTTAINQSELVKQFNAITYNWIVFTSTNAVKFFFENIESKNVTSKIAVVGEKTKRVLEKFGVEVDFMPTQFTARQLANELPISKNDSILIPRSDLAKNDIVEILESKSCKVETVSIYENCSIEYSDNELNSVFKQQIDFIAFTSGSTVNSFMKLGVGLRLEKIVCIGPETAKVAKVNSLIVAAIANPHTIEGMVKELIQLAGSSA